jgi:hypothetical protein
MEDDNGSGNSRLSDFFVVHFRVVMDQERRVR